jgi:hypothetical protein
MKKIYLLPALLGGLFVSELDSQAQDQPGGQVNIRELFLKEFDKNKDGKLDESERPSREQMQQFFQRQQGNTPSRPGESGPGQGRPGAGGGRPGEGRPGQGRPGQGGQGGFRPPNPVMEAIDKNKDGTLSTEELKNAAKALATLDKNKDGKIDQEEMRPQFNRGQGGREEFSRPGQGGQGGREGFSRPGQGSQGGREGFSRPGQGSQGGREQGGRSNPFAALGVNEAQQKKLDAVRQELSTQMRALFTDRDTPREERSAKMAKIREGFDAKIKEILTKEQYKKFEETRSARGGRGEGQGRRPGQGGREGFRRPGQEGGQGRPEAPRGREGQPSRPDRSES